jgi:WD40 repeat protein
MHNSTKGDFVYTNPQLTNMEMKRMDDDANDSPRINKSSMVGGPKRNLSIPKTMCESPSHLIGVQQETPLSWSNDGSTVLFASENHSIYLCTYNESKDGDITVPITETLPTQHKYKVLDAQFHPKFPATDEIVSCGMDGFIVWDTTNAIVKHAIPLSQDVGEEKYHTNQIECICFGYDGDVLFTGSKDNSIRIWNSGSKYEFLENLTAHKAPVLTITFCEKTEMLASSGRDSMIKIWNMKSISPDTRDARKKDPSIKCQLLSSMDGPRGDVCTLTWSDGGRTLFSGARDNSIKFWDVAASKELREITSANPHDADIRRLVNVVTNDGM